MNNSMNTYAMLEQNNMQGKSASMHNVRNSKVSEQLGLYQKVV